MPFLYRTVSVHPLRSISPSFFICDVIQKRFAGHNKWSKIRHKKGINDNKRAIVLSRFTKELITAVKESKSADPLVNPRLSALLARGRSLNISKSTVETAIKKAQGPDSQSLTQAIYEVSALGASFIIEVLTDRTNRSFGLIKLEASKFGGNIANVQYMFKRKGLITCQAESSEKLLEDALDLEAEDVDNIHGQQHIVLTPFTSMYQIADGLKSRGHIIQQVESSFICDDEYTVQLPEEKKISVQKLIDALDEIEDIVKIHHNVENLDD